MLVLHENTLLPEVEKFLAAGPHGAVVGDQRPAAANGETLVTRDPGTGEPLTTVAALQPADVDRAVDVAADAFQSTGWSRLTPHERGKLLHRWVDLVEHRKPIVAQIESLDAGKLLPQADGDVQVFIETFRYYIEMSLHAQRRLTLAVSQHEATSVRQPWGPCGFIFPWNFPILLFGWNTAPALAAGNTVVVKPAEDTPLSSLYVAALALEAGLPPGVVNVVPGYGGTAGAALARNPRVKRMSFTGSPEVGRLVGESCGRNLVPVKLELGGKGAAVVFDDVDIEHTASQLVGAITFHTGQVCCDATRWLVHKSIYDRFVSACIDGLKRVRVGYELDRTAQMGPVVSEKQRQRVLGYLRRGAEEGAEMLLEGGQAEVSGRNGFYVKPALLAGSLNNVAAREEIFGPVAYLCPFANEDEAIGLVNATDYGLANSVWSSDLGRCYRVAEAMVAGNSWINAYNLFPLGVPYAGVNKSGLGGGVLSAETFYDYLRPTSIVRPL